MNVWVVSDLKVIETLTLDEQTGGLLSQPNRESRHMSTAQGGKGAAP